jgi:hypothetical protein
MRKASDNMTRIIAKAIMRRDRIDLTFNKSDSYIYLDDLEFSSLFRSDCPFTDKERMKTALKLFKGYKFTASDLTLFLDTINKSRPIKNGKMRCFLNNSNLLRIVRRGVKISKGSKCSPTIYTIA